MEFALMILELKIICTLGKGSFATVKIFHI
jgi:hypothetical protein